MTSSWNEFKLDTLQHKAVLRVGITFFMNMPEHFYVFSSFQITERGTEAAAATSAFIFRMGPSKVMQFDRPFFLFIYDALNKVLLKIFDEVMNTFDQGCLILGSSS